MKTLVDFFSSVKLAIVLLIIITLASILGTLVPQHRTPAEYAAHYGQIAPLLINLEVTDLYHSWWYMGLLFLFSMNTAVCTLSRFPAKWRKALSPRIESEVKKLQTLKIHADFQKQSALAEAVPEVKTALANARYKVREVISDSQASILAVKKTIGLFGSDIVHLGLLIILIGGIISGFGGTRRTLTISEGQTLAVDEAGISLRLDKFTTDYYPNGAVKDWKSTLAVFENGQQIRTQTIEVNHPLSYKGFMFYQSSYGFNWDNPSFEILAKKKDDPGFLDTLRLGAQEKAKLSDGVTEIEIVNFVPDFIIGDNNEVATRSLQPNNPALLIEGRQQGERIFAAWVFSKFPDFSQMHSDKEHEFTFEFKNIESGQYSGIEMAKDPGVNFIWTGSLLLTLGLFVAFFWPPSEIRVHLEQDQSTSRTNIVAGGTAVKNRESLKQEFEKIMESIRSHK